MSQLIIAPNAMPALQLPADVLAKVQAQLKQAADNQSSSLPRLSFGGKMFNLTVGGSKVELQDRVLDVHIVAIDPNHHYVFNEFGYDDVKDKMTKVVCWCVIHCQRTNLLSHPLLDLQVANTSNAVS